MLTYFYFILLGVACLIALGDWRRAVYAAILLDFLRDPVRKLDPNEPVLVTVSILALWGIITVSAWNQSQVAIRQFLNENPRLYAAFRLLVLATLPGIAISLAFYAEGYKLVALGTVSYLAPSAGVLLGVLFASQPGEITKLLRFYCIVNGLALVGVVGEYFQLGWPALGGMRGMNWIRYSGDQTINLVAGFYRSPDIMGLHAAQVVMFAMVVAAQARRGGATLWLALAVFAGLCLLLSGRRKMLGMPLVFVAAFSVLCYIRGMKRFQFVVVPVLGVGVAVAGVYLVATDDYVADEYAEYASTLITEGTERSQQLVIGSVSSTLDQTGILGGGIGSATQGAYHISGGRSSGELKSGWQEDGVSRLFRELGLPGVILVIFSGVSLFLATAASTRRLSNKDELSYLQMMLLATVLANLASFVISHQQFSGDPPSALLVLFVLGTAFSLPAMRERYDAEESGWLADDQVAEDLEDADGEGDEDDDWESEYDRPDDDWAFSGRHDPR